MEYLHLDIQHGDRSVFVQLRDGSGKVLGTSDERLTFNLPAYAASYSTLSSKEVDDIAGRLGPLALPPAILEPLLKAIRSGKASVFVRVSPELEVLPWELTRIDPLGFLARHPSLRLSRIGSQDVRFDVRLRRILLVAANPSVDRFGRLDCADDEIQAIQKVLGRKTGIALEVLEHATDASLRRFLKRNFDVVHFIGHGETRPSGGVLILEGGTEATTSEIYADELARSLKEASVQLATFSCCECFSAPHALGFDLVRHGVPNVVGMRSKIGDVESSAFFRAFYGALVDTGLNESVFVARAALGSDPKDWSIPVSCVSAPLACFDRVESAEDHGRLPNPPSSFIGRGREIAGATELLREQRVVLLHGSGGIGKTRLSIETAKATRTSFRHGAWFVPLETAESDSDVPSILAGVFGIRATTQTGLTKKLIEFLSDREILLVLDNCEHVIEATRLLVDSISTRCPNVKCLLTSRQVLGLAYENVVRIPPLSYPDSAEEIAEMGIDEVTDGYEAVKLLAVRAKQADTAFRFDDGTASILAQIAKRLDGIPLALELAASRVRSFSPAQILDRLIDSLAWLDLENPVVVPRHKTLRATLDWSYRLLAPNEARVFNRLGIFNGSFCLEGAEFVASSADLPLDQIATTIAGLVDKSLLVPIPGASSMRYRLLDTCKSYALQRLADEQETEATRGRLLEFVAKLSEDAFGGMFRNTEDQKAWFERLAQEHDNCAQALKWALQDRKSPLFGAKVAKNLFGFWFSTRDFHGARHWLSLAADQIDLSAEELYYQVRTLAAVASVFCGDESGFRISEQILEETKPFSEELAFGFVAGWCAECASMTGQVDKAFDIYDEIRRYLRSRGRDEGTAQLNQAVILVDRGSLEQASEELETFLQNRLEKADLRAAGYALCHLAYIRHLNGAPEARELFEKGLRHFEGVQDLGAISEFLPLATVVLLPSHAREAAELHGFASRLVEEHGTHPDRIVDSWSDSVRSRTRDLLGDDYEAAYKDGRTLTLLGALRRISG